jgi:hypothetical protein
LALLACGASKVITLNFTVGFCETEACPLVLVLVTDDEVWFSELDLLNIKLSGKGSNSGISGNSFHLIFGALGSFNKLVEKAESTDLGVSGCRVANNDPAGKRGVFCGVSGSALMLEELLVARGVYSLINDRIGNIILGGNFSSTSDILLTPAVSMFVLVLDVALAEDAREKRAGLLIKGSGLGLSFGLEGWIGSKVFLRICYLINICV